MPSSFAQPYMYWVGADLPTEDPDEVKSWNAFYSGTHVPEVVAANPGFTHGHRYELVGPDPRGVDAPKYLAVYEMAHEGAARTYGARNDGPAEGRPKYTSGPAVWETMTLKWRMIWRTFAETGPAGGTPESIFVVGMNPPANASPAELTEFNDYYTKTHLPEVTEAGPYTRGTRHELYRPFLHPGSGAPRYLALYEADDPDRTGGPLPGTQPTPGPPIWDGRDTLWRLVYRRLPD